MWLRTSEKQAGASASEYLNIKGHLDKSNAPHFWSREPLDPMLLSRPIGFMREAIWIKWMVDALNTDSGLSLNIIWSMLLLKAMGTASFPGTT